MIGRYLHPRERSSAITGVVIGVCVTPFMALNISRHISPTAAGCYLVAMVVLLSLIGFQIRASHRRDKITNG